jgi:hypothetical protein
VSRLRYIASFLFLLLSLQMIVPAQLLHGFCDHEDTIDCCLNNGETTVSIHHEHCLVLDLTLPTVLHKYEDVAFTPQQVFISHSNFILLQTLVVDRTKAVIRGPPVFS